MVKPSPRHIGRRTLLRGAGAAVLAGGLGGCHGSPGGDQSTPARPSTSPLASTSANPLGVVRASPVELWTDSARLPGSWPDALATAANRSAAALRVDTNATTQLASDLARRFAEGNPPDLVLSGGPDPLPLGELAGELTDLAGLLDLPGSGGATLRSRLRPGVLAAGTLGSTAVALPAVWNVHGLWFSSTLFARQGWQPPSTWDELVALGRLAKARDMHLFCWGRETATWFQRMVLAGAVKQAGPQVARSVEQLDAGCWSQPAVQDGLQRMKRLVDAGMVRPGGAARPWREAITAWSRDQTVLFAPAGSWISAQSGVGTAFGLDVVADPALTTGAALPHGAHVQPDEFWVVPRQAANPAGGLELLQQAMGTANASAFCTANQVLSTLTDAEPAQRGSSVLAQEALLKAAGDDVFTLDALEVHGTNHDFQALWNAFLMGSIDVATLTSESQRVTDLVRNDRTIAKLAPR